MIDCFGRGLLVGAMTAAAVLAGCGGGAANKATTPTPSGPSRSTSSTSTGPTGPTDSTGPTGSSGRAVALSSPEAHAALVAVIGRSPNIPADQDDRIATCAIQKLQERHYTTVGQVPGSAATAVGRTCAEQVLGGIDSPVAHQVLLDRILTIPGVNQSQGNRITDCVIARFRARHFTSIATVPAPVATRAGQDCAHRIVGR